MPAVFFDPTEADFDPNHFRLERYTEREAGQSPLMRGYYAVKPLLPRPLQIAIRRRHAARRARREFPAWPIEPLLVDHERARFRRRIEETGGTQVPFVGYWPEGRQFASIVSHDVEGPEGIANIPRVLEVERKHGIVSCWNFCAEWYEIPDGTFEAVRAAGCEVGLHGILHDGKLFRDRASFEANLPKIHRYLEQWDVAGFRSPATHRNPDWMPELGCLYDGSFPDTDPFEPQAGGCCSIFPFFIGNLVELPITLVQDHTLWEILDDESIDRWVEKAEWVASNHGLVQLLVHPDYLLSDERLALYDSFLEWLSALDRDGSGWHALPGEVAEWWRQRATLSCTQDGNGEARIEGGPGAGRATVGWARKDASGEVALQLGTPGR
jgi:peptidoglycan/xylan/chitin deacetylase (PgdA/CDA1 family)